tara:strand:- start:22 stop:654 length:633 start_codon:yes stop_codon:yes gene_type:complete
MNTVFENKEILSDADYKSMCESIKHLYNLLKVDNEIKQENNVVNKDIRWGLVGTKINYSWLWTTMTERYDGDDEYDFEQDITNSENDNSISEEEYIICRDLSNQIQKHINLWFNTSEKIEDDVNDAISEIAELYKKCCPRCIEEYEDEEGKGERKESCCSGCDAIDGNGDKINCWICNKICITVNGNDRFNQIYCEGDDSIKTICEECDD